MSWTSQLFRTYENNIEAEQKSEVVLTPIAHMNANAQIEVVLNLEGEFQGARSIEKSLEPL